jgi:hypothetical protein
MAFKEVSRVEMIEIIRRWQANSSLRGLARATGLSRKNRQEVSPGGGEVRTHPSRAAAERSPTACPGSAEWGRSAAGGPAE